MFSIKKMFRPSCYALIMIVLALVLYSQEAKAESATATLDPTKIPIGGSAQLHIQIEYSSEAILQMPVFNEKINEKIEILDYGSNDTVRDRNMGLIRISKTLDITSWEEGFHAIAPISFLLIENDDTLTLETEPLLLEVEPFAVEENADLKDIKTIMHVPVTLAELKYYIIGAIVLLILIWLIYKYLKNRKKTPPPVSVWEKPDIPAHIAALGSLEKLKDKKLWQQGKVKLYHIELTDIMRKYIHKRYGVHALEMTTAEIMFALHHHLEKGENDTILRSILELADLVKFAKYQPTPEENEASMDAAFRFVNDTKIVSSEHNAGSDNTQKKE